MPSDAGGIPEISRWCKPPVFCKQEHKPRQGRWKLRGAIRRPSPGLAAFLCNPVVGTTG